MYEMEDGSSVEIGTITVTGGKIEYINLLPTALTPDDITTIFDGKGYKNGYYASAAEPFYNVDANFFCTGLMVIPDNGRFYIKGCTIDTSLSHTRFGLHGPDNQNINATTLSNWGSDVMIFTELGEQYYSVYINPSYIPTGVKPYYFYFSASGTGEGVIVSHTPIEVAEEENYTNLIRTSVDKNGNQYVGHNGEDGYSVGYRINSSTEEVQQDGMCCTGYIRYSGETIRLKNVTVAGPKTDYIAVFYNDKSYWQVFQLSEKLLDDGNGVLTGSIPSKPDGWIRITCGVIDDTSILTLNEEIV